VDSGRARGNWQPAINNAIGVELETTDKNGNATITKVGSETNNLKAGDTFYLSNNLPYAERLEYGWSKQAPSGMVRINLMLFDKILNIANMETK